MNEAVVSAIFIISIFACYFLGYHDGHRNGYRKGSLDGWKEGLELRGKGASGQ